MDPKDTPHSTGANGAAPDDPPSSRTDDDTPATRAELLDRAAAYAETVPIDVDLGRVSWEVSERAKRRAGVRRFEGGTETVTVRLTWAAYEAYGWAEFTGVIRHERVHAWGFQRFGESGHGERYREKAAEVGASRRCRSFVGPHLVLRCTGRDCDWSADRHRASKAVKDPQARRCGACGERYAVGHVGSGERWTTNEGDESARGRIDDDW